MRQSAQRGVTFRIRVALLVLVGLLGAPGADADTSFAGQWAASALAVTWNIGDWGDACGPKPSGGGERGGTATIEQVGNELVMSGIGRAYDTSSCWEPLPGLQRTSHSAGARNWRTTCKSPAGDPRQSSLVTTITALSDDQLAFDETGQYQFVIKGQNCTASVRRSRSFRRIVAPATTATTIPGLLATSPPVQAPATALVTNSSPAPTPSPATKATSSVCSSPGPPARIELRPSHKLMRPGESFAFSAAVADAHGCQLGLTPAFRLDGEATGVTLSAAGKVSVDAAAPESELKVLAAVGARSVQATLNVVSRERYDAMLAQGGFDPNGASTDAAVARFESGSVGSHSTVLEDESGRKRALFVGVVGATALGLGLMGLMLVRRGRNRAASPPAGEAPVREFAVPPPREPTGRPPMVCPTCRDEYPPHAQFCAQDGNRLIPLERGTSVGPAGSVCPICGQGYDPGVAVCPKHDEPLVPAIVYASSRAAAVVETRKICPVCGAQFSGESQFCGSCGAALVPVN